MSWFDGQEAFASDGQSDIGKRRRAKQAEPERTLHYRGVCSLRRLVAVWGILPLERGSSYFRGTLQPFSSNVQRLQPANNYVGQLITTRTGFSRNKKMKRGLLTSDEIRHLEHRWCVLHSFIEVADDISFSEANGNSREGRIFRGCKDGAIVTCRALCERFGITMNARRLPHLLPCSNDFKKEVKKKIKPSPTDSDCDALWDVLVAANRCVCHLEDKLIDHNVGNPELKKAVHFICEWIKEQVSDANLSSQICK